MALWWAPAAMQAGSALLKYATAKKPPRFETTAHGLELAKQKTQGIYSPAAESRIMGQAGAKAGAVAQNQKADIMGYLTARGMGNSIAGTRALAEPGLKTQEILADKAASLTAENEASKVKAADEYAQGVNWYAEARRQAGNQATEGLIGGLAGAAGSAVSGYEEDKFLNGEGMNDFDSLLSDIQTGKASKEEAQLRMAKLIMRYPNYGGSNF